MHSPLGISQLQLWQLVDVKKAIWHQLSHQQDHTEIKRGSRPRGRMLKRRSNERATCLVVIIDQVKSKSVVSFNGRREIHSHANLLPLRAKGVIQHLSGHWLSNSPFPHSLYLGSVCLSIAPHIYT